MTAAGDSRNVWSEVTLAEKYRQNTQAVKQGTAEGRPDIFVKKKKIPFLLWQDKSWDLKITQTQTVTLWICAREKHESLPHELYAQIRAEATNKLSTPEKWIPRSQRDRKQVFSWVLAICKNENVLAENLDN